jgi:hypothetical protein
MVRAKLKTRPTLITIAAIGLLLAYVSDFLALTKHESSMFGLIGNVLFFGALLAALPSAEQRREDHHSDEHPMTAVFCITAAFLLLANGFILTPRWAHGLLGIVAYSTMFFCWSLPNSRWTTVTILPILAIALLRIRWNAFADFAHIPPWIWLSIGVLWIATSLVAFRLIDKRERARAALN